MKLQVPFLQLPLMFDAGVLAEEINAVAEAAWMPHPAGLPGNSMLPLIAVDGDPANESFAGEMRPTPVLAECPYLMQVMASLGVILGRSRLMRLAGQAEVTRHADQGYYWIERMRVHVPIVTQPTVRFECGDAAINMAAGECWVFDTWRQHRVFNDAVESRIHLVVDTVGGDGFWQLMGKGRPHSAPVAAWHPQQLAPRPGTPVELICETSNVPTVMSPWEVRAHLSLLFSDAVPHPQLAVAQQITGRFYQRWRSLWAQHGDRPSGHAQFRAVLEQFMAEISGPAQPLLLKNELVWLGALSAMIARFAVGQEAPRSHQSINELRRAADNG